MLQAISSRDFLHNFSRTAARVAAGQEMVVTKRGKPLLKLVAADLAPMSAQERAALVNDLLAFRLNQSYGKSFERCDAYDE